MEAKAPPIIVNRLRLGPEGIERYFRVPGPDGLFYTKEHEWARVTAGTAKVG